MIVYGGQEADSRGGIDVSQQEAFFAQCEKENIIGAAFKGLNGKQSMWASAGVVVGRSGRILPHRRCADPFHVELLECIV